jgi:outer membrane lipoprotein SlyB
MSETFTRGEYNWKMAAGALAATLALAGCTSESAPESASALTAQSTAESTVSTSSAATSSTAPPTPGTTITIDALGGGTQDVFLYAGVGETAEDRATVASWLDGDTLGAECKTEGRTVSSDLSVGELPRTSNMWVRIQNDSEDQYATAVYIESPDEVLAKLPNC